MSKEVSAKNTKSEILDAYEAALKQAKELNKKNRQQEKELAEKEQLVAAAREQSQLLNQHSIDGLRQQINEQLSGIGEKMVEQKRQLDMLDQAIAHEEKTLADMYDIKKSAHTLDTLLLAHKHEMAAFDREMNEKKQAWQAEQEKIMSEREHEQQEYDYQTKITRQKEEDEYNARKQKQEADLKYQKEEFEVDLAKRDEVLSLQEAEVLQMREKIEGFPAQLEKVMSDVAAETTARLNREHKFQFDLLEKERQGEQLLSQQTIASLEMKVKSLEAAIQEANEKLNGSTKQVQAIAVKAIEGAAAASGKIFVNAKHAKELETV